MILTPPGSHEKRSSRTMPSRETAVERTGLDSGIGCRVAACPSSRGGTGLSASSAAARSTLGGCAPCRPLTFWRCSRRTSCRGARREPARRTGLQIPDSVQGMGLVVCLPCQGPVERSAQHARSCANPSTNPSFSARVVRPSGAKGSTSRPVATGSATASPHSSSRTATASTPSRSSRETRTSPRP